MTPGPGIEPGTPWWESSALPTAPSLSVKHCNFTPDFSWRFEKSGFHGILRLLTLFGVMVNLTYELRYNYTMLQVTRSFFKSRMSNETSGV